MCLSKTSGDGLQSCKEFNIAITVQIYDAYSPVNKCHHTNGKPHFHRILTESVISIPLETCKTEDEDVQLASNWIQPHVTTTVSDSSGRLRETSRKGISNYLSQTYQITFEPVSKRQTSIQVYWNTNLRRGFPIKDAALTKMCWLSSGVAKTFGK